MASAATLLASRPGQSQSRSRSRADGAEGQVEPRVGFDQPETHRWRVGLHLKTRSTCEDVTATFPIPVDWPEQEVRVVNKNVDAAVTAWTTRPAPGGTTQVVVKMRRVTAGSEVDALFDFDVKKFRITPPEQVDDLVIPKKVDRDIRRMYLGTSPEIDYKHRLVRDAFQKITAEPYENAWQLVRNIYDHVRDQVRYVNGPLRKASDALRLGHGDCEEMTSLVVGLCRSADIPARMVWIPDHCYPEFYLEDSQGHGHWFPCQAAGTPQFGGMEEYKPILQKGDHFKVPEKRAPQRYLTEFFTCRVRGKGDPRPDFMLQRIES